MLSPLPLAVTRSRIVRSGISLYPSSCSRASCLPLATLGLSPIFWTAGSETTRASPASSPASGLALLPASPFRAHGQARGKRTKTTVNLDDLPQGRVSSADPLPPEDRGPAYPTVVMQARRNMQRFDNCVLLTRVGGFYELYFEQAEEYGPLLNLKVAQKKTNAGPVPMVNLVGIVLSSSRFPFLYLLPRYAELPLISTISTYLIVLLSLIDLTSVFLPPGWTGWLPIFPARPLSQAPCSGLQSLCSHS